MSKSLQDVLLVHGIIEVGCGASCGDGWVPLIEELIPKLILAGWDKDLHQIKEKYGGLRFYIGSGSDKIHDLITEAESKSYEICDECGGPGTLRQTSWWRTLCDECVKVN